MSRLIITSRHSEPAHTGAPSLQPHTLFGEEHECPPEQDASSDLFPLTCGFLMGAIIGGMLALSFAPSWTTL